jgi:hypothetical protein
MKTIFAFFLSLTLALPAMAAKLEPGSPEYKQLEAMGYDLQPHPELNGTIAKLGDTIMVLDLDAATSKLEITRMFRLRETFKAPEIELYKLINDFNRTSSYKWFVHNGVIAVYTTYTGPYNAKALALLMNGMERLDGKLILHMKDLSQFAE